ncbi:hypothetical protein IAT38_000666 [Cryptococcus sp. DSM 104549]
MSPPRKKANTRASSSAKPLSRSSSSSSAGSAATASSSSTAPTKKMGSLSSFQSTLGFKRFTMPSRSNGSPAPGSSKADKDKSLMPPPPVPSPEKKVAKLPPTKASTKATTGRSKAKKVEVIEVISSDEESPVDKKGKGKAEVFVDQPQDMAQMWSELYTPTTEAELATGKARIQKVKVWMHEALFGCPPGVTPNSHSAPDKLRKYRRILLLTGPAGTGKTTTVRLLADQMGVDLVEWTDSVEEWSLGGGIERESSMSKFKSFISRNAYPSLHLSSQPSSSSSAAISKPRIILLTSLPNLTHLPTREAFHESLIGFCKQFNSSSCPMIIVHSDAGSGGRAEESWMDRDRGGREGSLEVLGKEVKNGPWVQEIDFISLAPTFITSALNRVLQIAIPKAADRPAKSTLQLIALTSNGDLRSAINSVQLLCTERKAAVKHSRKRKAKDLDDMELSQGSQKSSAKGRGSRGGRGSKLDVGDEMRAVLDAVTRREQSLGLFHALGKVFYNKRLDDPPQATDDQEIIEATRRLTPDDPLLPHLAEFERRKSLVRMETFMPTIPVDASSFALWAHQSFPSFCNQIEEVSAGMDELCAADVMRTDDDIWHSSPQAIAYSLYLTVRGVQMALPSPAPRKNQKVIKPQFFESYRSERDNLVALDSASRYLQKKGATANNVMADIEAPAKGKELPSHAPWGGLVTKNVLATELVPMMVKIQALSRTPLLPSAAQTLCLAPWTPLAQSRLTASLTELTVKDEPDEEEYEATAAGEDGLGDVPRAVDQGVWDDEMDQGVDEEDYLEDDDIVDDWD